MKYVVVVPFAYQPYFDEFIKTVKIPRENMLIIDNTEFNRGIMRSHNMGVEEMYKRNADYLIVMSAGIRFGEKGGIDFIKIVEDHPECLMIHGAGKWDDHGEEKDIALGWHLTAFKREVFDKVGKWDENFSPYSLDDVDLTLRIQRAFGMDYKLGVFPCDMRHTSTSHSISKAGVKASYHPRNSYFTRKWGRDGGDWQTRGYETPFNIDVPLSYWPEPDDPLSIWQNEYQQGYKYDE